MRYFESFEAKDVYTPANGITAVGLFMVLVGSFYLHRPVGLLLVALGRAMDLLDGPVARRTKTTRFSIVFDPFADKIALAAIIAAVWAFELVPLAIIAYIALQNIAVSVLAFRAYDRGAKIGATVAGKLNMFFQTMTILLFIASNMTPTGLSDLLTVLGYANFITSIPLAAMTLLTYKFLLRRHK